MGLNCSRKTRSTSISEEDAADDWLLIALPEDILERVLEYQISSSFRAPTPISSARGRWIRAVLKVRLLRHFRLRWSRAGAWLNTNPIGSVPQDQRALVSRLWASDGRWILVQFHTRDLFAPVVPRSRLTRADQQERDRYRVIGASLRAVLDLD